MRPSARALLLIRPIPAAAVPAGAARLPPALSAAGKGKGKARQLDTSPLGLVLAGAKAKGKGREADDATAAAVGTQVGAAAAAGEAQGAQEILPPNLRLESHVPPKSKYWKVSSRTSAYWMVEPRRRISYAHIPHIPSLLLHVCIRPLSINEIAPIQVARPERQVLQKQVFRER